MVEFETVETEKWVLTEEGRAVLNDASYEVKVFNMIPPEGLSIAVVQVQSVPLIRPRSDSARQAK